MSKRLVWHKEEVQDVIALFLACKTKEEIEKVFDRVLTPREINDIARRHKAIVMIDEGKSYADIKMATGMSGTTIARLSAKCGFGFQKSSGLPRQKAVSKTKHHYRTIKYKGVTAVRVKR